MNEIQKAINSLILGNKIEKVSFDEDSIIIQVEGDGITSSNILELEFKVDWKGERRAVESCVKQITVVEDVIRRGKMQWN